MRVFRDIMEYKKVKHPVVTVGTFDGVHVGHRKILSRINELAREYQGESLLLTFWPHPRVVLQPEDNTLRLLNTMEEKIELLEKTGLDNLLIIPFTKAFSRTTSGEFIKEILVNTIGAKLLVIGYDHHFGKNREGSFGHLQQHAPSYGFRVEEIPAQQIDETAVSSTKIRRALEAGDVSVANDYLGYEYFVQGEVVHGDKLGRQLNFPTANIQVEASYKMIPADGVYAVKAVVEGKQFKGMLNSGTNPTIEGKGRSLEVHLFDFNGDLYHKVVRVMFLQRLRSEMKFNSLEELKKQMVEDERNARDFLSHTPGLFRG